MTFNPAKDYGDDRLCLEVTGEYQGRSLVAYCCPDAEGQTYLDDKTEVGEPVEEMFGAPFNVDIVLLNNVYPEEGEMQSIRDELGTEFASRLEDKTTKIYDAIQDSDDPMQELLDLEPSDL